MGERETRQNKMRERLKQKSRSLNLKWASDELRRDRKVVLTAMLNHPGSLVHCLDEDMKKEFEGLSRQELQEARGVAIHPSIHFTNHPSFHACTNWRNTVATEFVPHRCHRCHRCCRATITTSLIVATTH